MPRILRYLPGACLALTMAAGASAQGSFCLEEIEVRALGTVTLNLGAQERQLVVLEIEVEDILFDGAERLSSAVHLTGQTATGAAYQLLSIAAYPEGFGAQLAAQLCGEDLLDVIDAYRLIGEGGDPMSGATGGFGASVLAVTRIADGSYRIEGRFGGGLLEMAPAEGEASALADFLGVPDMVKGAEALPAWGEFRIEVVLPGNLSDLPKVF